MMRRISLILLLFLIELCTAQSDTCRATTEQKCRNKGGLCQPKDKECAGPRREGPQYCKDSETCDCCAPCSKGIKPPCQYLNGTCMNHDDFCNGTSIMNKAFCKQQTLCKCCFPACDCDPATCTYNNQDGRCSRHRLPDTKKAGTQQCKNGCECYIADIQDIMEDKIQEILEIIKKYESDLTLLKEKIDDNQVTLQKDFSNLTSEIKDELKNKFNKVEDKLDDVKAELKNEINKVEDKVDNITKLCGIMDFNIIVNLLESSVQNSKPVRNSYPNMKSGGPSLENYGFKVNENTIVKKGMIETSLELPSVNGMDNEIVINQNRNRISGNSKLVVNQIDNEIFGNSEIEVNQQDNKIGGKIDLYNKESATSEIAYTTADFTTKLPATSEIAYTTADSTTKLPDGCPEAEGFLKSGKQCFKFFPNQGMTWDNAKTLCQDEGLVLGKPDDPATAVALRKLLVETYAVGVDKLAWLGARGTDSREVQWDRDGTTLSSTSSLWNPGQSGRGYKSHCLEFMVRESNLASNPTTPYYMAGCSGTNKHPLCELVM